MGMTNEQIISAIGFDGATDEVKQGMVDKIRQVVEMRTVSILGELMTDEQSDEFQRLTESGNDQAVWDWLRDSIVGTDVSEVYEGALQDYLDEFNKRQAETMAKLTGAN